MPCLECKFNDLCISKIGLFKDLSPDLQKKLFTTAIHRDVGRNELIFRAEDSIEQILLIRYGKIKTCLYDVDGKEYIGHVYVAGDTIGEDSIFLEKDYDMDLVTVEKTGFCIISHQTIRDFLLANTDFSMNLIASLSKKLDRSEKLLEIMSIKNAYKRLAAFLLYRSQILKNDFVTLNQENIASSINMTRETVSRKLTQLEADGLIELTAYKKIRIKNKPALIELARI